MLVLLAFLYCFMFVVKFSLPIPVPLDIEIPIDVKRTYARATRLVHETVFREKLSRCFHLCFSESCIGSNIPGSHGNYTGYRQPTRLSASITHPTLFHFALLGSFPSRMARTLGSRGLFSYLYYGRRLASLSLLYIPSAWSRRACG